MGFAKLCGNVFRSTKINGENIFNKRYTGITTALLCTAGTQQSTTDLESQSRIKWKVGREYY